MIAKLGIFVTARWGPFRDHADVSAEQAGKRATLRSGPFLSKPEKPWQWLHYKVGIAVSTFSDFASRKINKIKCHSYQTILPYANVLRSNLYVAYLGTLEVYRKHTAASVLVNGARYLCSTELQEAIDPLIHESRRIQAEKDLDRAIALMKVASESDNHH